MKTKKMGLLLAIGMLFTSCNNDDDSTVVPRGDYEDGILVSHEGNFGQGNASVSYLSYDFTVKEDNIFSTVNFYEMA